MIASSPDVVRRALSTFSDNQRGALWMLLAGVLFTAMGILIKILGAHLHGFQIAFFRAFVALLVLLPFAMVQGRSALTTKRPGLHLLRAILGTGAMLCGFYAITHLPLADAFAIMFSRPLFVTVLAVLVLGEVVRARRWAATAIGFTGVLIMLRPQGSIETAAWVAVGGTALVAGVMVMVKQLTATEKPITLLLYFGIFSSVLAIPPAALVWQTPTIRELLMLTAVGVLAVIAQSCYIRALALGEASAIAPFDYLRLIYAGLFGYLLFGDLPDSHTLMGAGLIVASALYVARRAGNTPAAAPSADPA